MLVKELKEKLKDVPDDYQVVMSSDAEGNSYSPLYEIDVVMYVPENTYMGEVWDKEWTAEMEEEYKENAVAMWPTN